MQLGYIIVYVRDVPATVAFYERAFGLVCRFRHETQYAEMETGGTALAFVDEAFVATSGVTFKPNRATDAAAGIEVGFVSKDVQAAFDTALAAGATAVVAPLQKPWGQTVSYVRDCNGVLVEICSPIPAA
jgi:lactoylglutathione lyase